MIWGLLQPHHAKVDAYAPSGTATLLSLFLVDLLIEMHRPAGTHWTLFNSATLKLCK